MPPIPNRDALEAQYARLMAKLLQAYGGRLLEKLGDPPSLDNLPSSFWDEEAKELVKALVPFGQRVYLEAAERMLAETTIGVDWALVNQGAIEWARTYTFGLVTGLTDTTRTAVSSAVSDFFNLGLTRGELEDMLVGVFGPVRASMIAVTEVTRASVEGERGLAKELAESGIVMIERWNTNNDDLVCDICEPLNQKVRGDGWEESDGPPAHVNCLPGDTPVLPIGRVAAGSERWYEGWVIVIETLENKLTVTPNHPILTPCGWIPAGSLIEGDNVFGYSRAEWEKLLVDTDKQDRVSTIQDIFSSIGVGGFTVPVSPPDFHNDGIGSDVAVIRTNSEVMDNVKSFSGEPFTEQNFIGRDVVLEVPFPHLSSQAQLIEGNASATGGIVSGADLASALLSGHPAPLDSLGFGLGAGLDTSIDETQAESGSGDTSLQGEFILGLAGKVSLQEIVNIRNEQFCGHVYNLQTESGLYVADGIITHNCRCWTNHELQKAEA